jgi:uncharacterized membrane protein YeiB
VPALPGGSGSLQRRTSVSTPQIQGPLPEPIAADERLHARDILRGLALFGMILVHFHQFMRRDARGLEDLIGWGLKLRPLAYVPAAVGLFGIEASLSRAWLARFRFGPLEWIWRTITYAALQPLRRDDVTAPGRSRREQRPGRLNQSRNVITGE